MWLVLEWPWIFLLVSYIHKVLTQWCLCSVLGLHPQWFYSTSANFTAHTEATYARKIMFEMISIYTRETKILTLINLACQTRTDWQDCCTGSRMWLHTVWATRSAKQSSYQMCKQQAYSGILYPLWGVITSTDRLQQKQDFQLVLYWNRCILLFDNFCSFLKKTSQHVCQLYAVIVKV